MKDKSMKTLFGVLCCVAFTLTSAAYHPFQENRVEAEATESVPAVSSSAEAGQTGEDEEVEKATTLVAVTTKKCPPCRRLKYLTITVLLAQGYDVVIIPNEEWYGPAVKKFPTLVYYNEEGRCLRVETGFKTAAHVKKYLAK